MAYTINKFNGEELLVLEDGTIDTSTSLGLVGRNYVGYGETQNENYVFLLENFANTAPPSRVLLGQLWFDSTNKVINAYNGTDWYPVGNAVISDTEPSNPSEGQMWLVTPINQLFVYTNGSWSFIGPEAVPGFGTTRAKSTTLLANNTITYPVIQLLVNDVVVAICSANNFTIASSNAIEGFETVVRGITLSTSSNVKGNLQGNANTASLLENPRTINGVAFSGDSNITITSNTTNRLIPGDYILGNDFNGSIQQTWNIDATSANIIGKVVVRNSAGGFAAGIITADLVGNVTGNVTATTGTSRFNVIEATSFIGATLTGNAFSATRLQTERNINGVAFNGTQDIIVTANAQTLTGTNINSTVLNSNLRTVGTLTNLRIENDGIVIGSNFKLYKDDVDPVIKSETDRLTFTVGASTLDIRTAAGSLNQGWEAVPTIAPVGSWNLGSIPNKFGKVFATEFKGNADTATLAASSTNIVGGGAGSIPYQTAAGTTAMLPVGAPNTYLRAGNGNTLVWGTLEGINLNRENLVKGNFIILTDVGTNSPTEFYNSGVPVRIEVDAISTNTAGKIVARDNSGNFAAGTITASLIGNVTGNATGNSGTATRLQTPRTINGVSFDGTTNITINAVDSTKVPLAGGTMTGFLTLNALPTQSFHATPKSYVDSRLPQYTFITGNTVFSTSGFTNRLGIFDNTANYFDVFPPSGKSMGNFVAFIPSIAVIHYAGSVDGNDSLRCTWSNLGDRIRVYVQNTEQRSTPAANYMAIWS
jgi:hypothetical protein